MKTIQQWATQQSHPGSVTRSELLQPLILSSRHPQTQQTIEKEIKDQVSNIKRPSSFGIGSTFLMATSCKI